MKLYSFIKSLLIIVFFSSGLLNAQVIPGRWEKVDALPQGEEIIVTLKTDDRLECAMKESGADDLAVVTSTGPELKIAKSDVEKIETLVEDGIRNGVLIGAAVGFAGPVIVTFASGVDRTEIPLGFAIVGAGVGTVVGYLLDKRRNRAEVLYQAP